MVGAPAPFERPGPATAHSIVAAETTELPLAEPGTGMRFLLRLVERHGWLQVTVLFVLVVVVTSVVLTLSVNAWQGDQLADLWGGIGIAVSVPLLVATPSIALQLRLVAHLAEIQQCLRREVERRQATEARLREVVSRDSLTGLATRVFFLETASKLVHLCARRSQWVAVLAIDVDGFKAMNDSAGHAAGDRVLVEIGELVKRHLRQSDVAGRLGGDELAVILPEADTTSAAQVAERIQRAVEAGDLGVTVSIGVAAGEGSSARLDDLIGRADRALYAAKRQGRNRVVLAAPERLRDPS